MRGSSRSPFEKRTINISENIKNRRRKGKKGAWLRRLPANHNRFFCGQLLETGVLPVSESKSGGTRGGLFFVLYRVSECFFKKKKKVSRGSINRLKIFFRDD